MKSRIAVVLSTSLLVAACSGETPEPPPDTVTSDAAAGDMTATEPTPDEQMAELVQMCADAAPAIEQRQAERSLYERLGQREGIRAVLTEMVDVHMGNPDIKPLFDGVDIERFLENSTDFISAGTGGDAEYKGRDLTEVHQRMNLNNALFLAAGADLEQAMQNLGVGADERQEVMCALVSLRGLVMPESAGNGGS